MAWFRDEEVLQQMLSLIQAYQKDSSSPEIIEELAGLRVVLAQLWLDVDSSQMQTLFHTPVGDITKALIQARFGRSLLDEQDQRTQKQLAQRARDLAQLATGQLLEARICGEQACLREVDAAHLHIIL